MQTINVRTTQNVSIQYPLASIGDRILAYLLDRMIMVGYGLLIFSVFYSIELKVVWVWILFIGLPIILYHLLFEIFMNGQSPGKKVMKIQVVKLDGTEATFSAYLLRWIFSIIDFGFSGGALALLVIAIGGKGQRIGDVVAGTCVVKLIEQKEITAEEVFITPEENYSVTFPQAEQLSPRDIELIQKALEAQKNFGNEQPVVMITEKVKTLLGVRSDLTPNQFLITVVKDYNHLTAL